MKKRLLLLLILILITLSSCGTVKTEAELVAYARRHYGKAELLWTAEDETSRICCFLDKDLSFEYYVESSQSTIDFDGTYFGTTETTRSNYKQAYFCCLANRLNEAHDLSGPETGYFTYEKGISAYDVRLVLVIDDSTPDHEKRIRDLAALVKEHDRKKQNDQNVRIVNAAKERLGEYDCKTSRYLTQQEVSADFYMEKMKSYTGRKPKYLYCESAAPDEVEGLEDFMTVDSFSPDENDREWESITLYYFEMDGETYFITDCLVYVEDHPEQYYVIFYNTYTGTPME